MAITVLIVMIISFFVAVATAETSTYIIHMDLSAKPLPFPDHQSWFSTTLTSVITDRNPKIIYAYTDSVHGFSAVLTNSELQRLKHKPGYVSFTKDLPVKLHTTFSPQFIGLNSTSGTWPVSNYGAGTVIGIIDTGIWPDSPSFHDDGLGSVPSKWKGECQFNSSSLCNKKLIGARLFNKGLFANNPDLRGTKIGQYSSPYDTIGHGTHVAAIAAGNHVKNASYFSYAQGTASGMAPHAHIAIYKAAWEEGIYASDVIAAIDQAIRDGVDVISLSLGLSFENDDDEADGFGLENDPIAVAAFAAIQKGVFVVASGGNDGPYYWSLINGAPWITTVGAGTIGRQFQGTLTLGNGVSFNFPSLFPGDIPSVQFPVTYIESCKAGNKTLANIIVVCYENVNIESKLQQAKSTGAAAVVLVTDKLLTEQDTIEYQFPVAFISSKHGEAIKSYALSNKNNATARLEFRKTVIGTKQTPEVDIYSSRGPFTSFPQILKPDILAPGTLILSAWPPVKPVAGTTTRPLLSGFNLLTGTSMAAPHVAGVAALIKQVHPNWSPSAIKSAIMTTALTLDNPLAVGAGHLSTKNVLNPGLIYDTSPQDFINFLCHNAKQSRKLINIITRSNLSDACKNPSPHLNYPSIIAYFTSDQNGPKIFRRTLTNVGEAKTSYSVRVRGLKGLNVVIEPKRLMFSEKSEKLSYTVRLESPIALEENVLYGSVSWFDEDEAKSEVSCSVVATSLVKES
ncbi:PREDICTED: subtilisin-like protease SBT1.9 [Camelina sativa]|uniref:Subtilisin-like protease SBT1.9 n=1 Tax=Camelina sativa TaxID=90675 RepID=A0ABM0XE28_CAMSA|nr:PREDICTED: subtilisin-like protease SBT1.9 [Camelina sativa]